MILNLKDKGFSFLAVRTTEIYQQAVKFLHLLIIYSI